MVLGKGLELDLIYVGRVEIRLGDMVFVQIYNVSQDREGIMSVFFDLVIL